MTPASLFRTRPARAMSAFVMLISAFVLVPGGFIADAAGEDLSIAKTVDQSTIAAGAISAWTLLVETSGDASTAADIVVTDTLPDGLCPLGAGDPDCPGGPAPSPAYTSATENADGTWTLIWSLPDMGTSEQIFVNYSTVARTHYQDAFADDTPVLARDSWTNTVHLDGTVDGLDVNDASAAGQSAVAVTIGNDVAERPGTLVGPGVCGDGSALTWNSTYAAGYRIGDQACWRVVVEYPTGLSARGSVIDDVLPPGHVYTANDTWAVGSNNTVPPAHIDASTIGAGDTTLIWTVGDGGGYVGAGLYLEVVFSSTIVDPGATSSGDDVTNRVGFAHLNTNGASFNSNSAASVEVTEPELDLIKGVVEVNSVATGGGANHDGVQVGEADVVTYQLTVANNGDVDASDVEIWDLLDSKFAPCSTTVSGIEAGGLCVDLADRIEWNGAATFAVAANSSVTRTYDITVPTGIAPNEVLGNEAGIRGFTSVTNNGGGVFSYVPVSNIDSAVAGGNTTVADDPSHVATPMPTIGNTRTSSITEAGNAHWQATIGELITYTITVVVPEGTTIYDASVTDDLPVNLDLVSASYTFDGEQALTKTEDVATDTVTVDWPDPFYTNAPGSGDDILTTTIVGRVVDVPINNRGTVVGNVATFAWHNDDGARSDIGTSVSTTLVEPLLGTTKSSIDSIGDDGIVFGSETVDYTITISDSGTTNVSTAHDVVVVDTLPEGVTLSLPVPDGGVWVADATPGDGIGGTITWHISSLAPGTSVDRSYEVTVDDPVTVSTVFVNNVAVNTSSMAGAAALERTAGTGYHSTAGHILNSPLVSIANSVASATATIGDIATYRVDIAIPPGTIIYDATVLATLADGLSFDGMVASSCDMAGVSCDPLIDVGEVGVVGSTTAAFVLGDIDAPSTTGQTRTVSITFEAHVLDSGGIGDTRMTVATVYGNATDKISGTPVSPPDPSGFDIDVGPAAASFRLVEPLLSIDKDVTGQTGDSDYRRAVPGETVDYTLVVTNSNGSWRSNAYDITIVDTLPENVTVTLPIADGGSWIADGTLGDGVGGTITWTEPGPLASGDSLSRTYEVTVEPGLDSNDEDSGDSELSNTADVISYYGVSTADRTAGPSFDFRNYNNVTADLVELELDLASIGDRVWYDINADGSQDAGEPPLEAVDLTVTYLGPDGTASGDDEVHAVSSGLDGSYLVEDLPGGAYTVVIDTSDLLPGFTASYDLDDGTLSPDDMWGVGPLLENEDKLNVGFGYTGTGSIAGSVWFDSDVDGAFDADEYALEGVDIVVTWSSFDGVPSGDDVVYLTSTDSAGTYVVPYLPAGEYTVDIDTVTLPAGMHATYDSDGIGTANATAFNLGPGEDNVDQHFGYAGAGAIGNWVWLDKDGDGIQDGSEFGLANVPVQLTWPGEDGDLGGGDDELFLTTTDHDGFYLYDNLPPGEYRVDVLGGLPTAAASTFDEDGGMDSSTLVDLADAENHRTTDFGFQGTASIGDAVWWDIDGDGSLDVGEPGIEGVEIILTYAGEDLTLDSADDLALIGFTDAAGSYLFSDLPAGNYRVAVNSGEPVGMVPTHDEDGGLDEVSLVTGLAVDQIHLAADFGYNGTGSLGDYVWLDLNADGVQDAIEPGIPGVGIDLNWYGVDGVAGTADDVVLSTATDVDGNYLIGELPAGSYDVSVVVATLPNGVTATYDPDGAVTANRTSALLGDGENNLAQDFGYNGGGTIGDTIWFDRNSDGLVDAEEYGIPGVDVDVIWAGPDDVLGGADDESFTATTDMNGKFVESSLPPGGYAVVVHTGTLPPGLTPTHDEDGTLDDQTLFALADGELHLTADFGYNGAGRVGDAVWLDVNGDGVLDAGEPGIPGQTVDLTWIGVDGVPGNGDDHHYASITDSAGRYLFDNLPPGDYEVAVAGPITGAAVNTADEDGDYDSRSSLSLADGAVHMTADFGYRGTSEIGDRVWLDLSGDGVADTGEPGLENVEVTVIWFGGDDTPGGNDDLVLPPLSTGDDGTYLAAGLPAGSFAVHISAGLPTGLFNTADEDGDLDGRTEVADLVAGGSHLSADFGYSGAGSIGDTVWWDLDGDGSKSPDEPGMRGIDVELRWAGFDDVFGDLNDAVFLATTLPDGTYLFDNLVPGTYELVVDETDLVIGVNRAADPDSVLDGRTTGILGVSEANLDMDFGYRGDGAIGDLVWFDLDRDRVHDPAEPGLGDAIISATFLGADGVTGGSDDVAFSAATGSDGRYAIPGLPSGFYTATIDEASLPPGLEVAGDLDDGDPLVAMFTLGAAAVRGDVDYSVVGDSELNGTVWNDRDGSGSIEPSEVGVAGITVIATWQGPAGPVTISAESDAFGRWVIPQLPAGDFSVEIDATSAPVGMIATTESSNSIVLAVGDVGRMDFGLAFLLNVESFIWLDADGDGVVAEAEAGVPDVLVNLYDEDDLLVGIAETGADGSYEFSGVFPGVYTLRLVPDSLPSHLRPTWDRDGTADLTTVLDLRGGNDILDANFGFQSGLPVTGLGLETLTMVGVLTWFTGMVLIIVVGARRRLVAIS